MNQDQFFSILATKMLQKRQFKELKYRSVPLAALQLQLSLLGWYVLVKHKSYSKKVFYWYQ